MAFRDFLIAIFYLQKGKDMAFKFMAFRENPVSLKVRMNTKRIQILFFGIILFLAH